MRSSMQNLIVRLRELPAPGVDRREAAKEARDFSKAKSAEKKALKEKRDRGMSLIRSSTITSKSEFHHGSRAPATKEKGGSPEDARQKVNTMEAVMDMPLQSKGKVGVVSSNSPDKNASIWLTNQIDRARKGVVTEVVDLTPALARVLLARNKDNRSISTPTVENYARDMANGAWVFNGEPIIISNDGLLNDGQHRCEAVLMADVSVPCVIVIGLGRETRMTVDQGKMRSAGDYLGMNGYGDSLVLACVAKYVWQHQNLGYLSSLAKNSPTKGEIISMIDGDVSIAESVSSVQIKNSIAVGGRSILAFVHWTIWHATANKTNADIFIDALINGTNLGIKSPILYARNRMMSERGRLKVNEKTELIIRAWNASRRGDKVASLPIKGGPLPALER